MGATNRSKSTMTSEQNNFAMRGCLEGHSNWVTAIATTNENPDMILSASRDKTVMVWQLTREEGNYGYPKKALRGHGHFVEDVVISSDGQFALSGSGTAPSVCGTSTLGSPLVGLLDTTRMSCRLPSLPTTVRSCLAPATRLSSSGTPWVSASTPSCPKARATPSGCLVCLSPLTPRTLLSCLVAGTSSSRCGTFPTASSAPTSSGTVATSTLSLSPQMAPCVPLVARMVLLCSGTLTRASACTPSHASRVTSFILSASRQTDTGCVLPPTMASASGISRARASWTSSSSTVSTCQRQTSSPRLCQCPASPSRGLLTVTLSSLVTLMA